LRVKNNVKTATRITQLKHQSKVYIVNSTLVTSVRLPKPQPPAAPKREGGQYGTEQAAPVNGRCDAASNQGRNANTTKQKKKNIEN
jgi:hypothetical protein